MPPPFQAGDGVALRRLAASGISLCVRFAAFAFLAALVACSGCGKSSLAPFDPGDAGAPEDSAALDGPAMDSALTDSALVDASVSTVDAFSSVHFCDLPGSVQYADGGVVVVPGNKDAGVDLSFLTLPPGFCAHAFGIVGNARQMRFAPGGELFVASPSRPTTSNGPNGTSEIVVLPDDDGDGFADGPVTFLGSLSSTQGLLFSGARFYYQDDTRIMSVPYARGDRAPSGPSRLEADITVYPSALHWPRVMDIADDGTLYVGNGGDQGETCDPTRPFHGGILKLNGDGGSVEVARGLRNPIALRCQRGHNLCYALELALDYSAAEGGREKVLLIQDGDDWGHPCCATRDVAFPTVSPKPDCSRTATESNAFVIGHTPFGIDFESGRFPPPWNASAFIALHGAAGPWTGARLVTVATDPTTGKLLAGDDRTGASVGSLRDFASGWDDGTRAHGRPAALAFSPDGRLFVANDTDGTIFWIAPFGL